MSWPKRIAKVLFETISLTKLDFSHQLCINSSPTWKTPSLHCTQTCWYDPRQNQYLKACSIHQFCFKSQVICGLMLPRLDAMSTRSDILCTVKYHIVNPQTSCLMPGFFPVWPTQLWLSFENKSLQALEQPKSKASRKRITSLKLPFFLVYQASFN